ncbi:MAG: hypothetical protein J0J10_17935 [Bosea sp.]|uniref:hypothetical protein n=1 Tax=Bosea sp. (in: a-proteobacteria) TaxID=1871050 RepID=UPI001ACD55C5|nr:hypothetical protein [Bosea sp. (in: a-proteobacteria)]MBN9470649.1 hypothetical protein [Bosea sp. (in: a-proteobacteria)]
MSNLMSPARHALLTHLAGLEPPKGELESRALEIAGITARTAANFIRALVDDDLIRVVGGFGAGGLSRGLFITEEGRRALADTVVAAPDFNRKVDDRSAELAKVLANPAVIRANARDVHAHLVGDQPDQTARRNLLNVEELISILNGVIRISEVGRSA